MNPEIATSSKGVEEDVKTVVGSSGLTREQLEGLTVNKLIKGKEKVKEEMEYIEPKAEQLDILKKDTTSSTNRRNKKRYKGT